MNNSGKLLSNNPIEKGELTLTKKTFTTIRLAVYLVTILQLMFTIVKSNVFTGVMITLGIICAIIDVIDLTGSYHKIVKDAKDNKKK